MSQRDDNGGPANSLSQVIRSRCPTVSMIASLLRRQQEAVLENLQEENKVLRDQVGDTAAPSSDVRVLADDAALITQHPRSEPD